MTTGLTSGPRSRGDVTNVGSGLSRGPSRNKRKIYSPIPTGEWPAPNSTLDLDFINNRSYINGYGQGAVMDKLTYAYGSGTGGQPQTMFNSSGNLSFAPHNLVNYSENFTAVSGIWLTSTLTLSLAMGAAPDGSNAWRITDTVAASAHQIYNYSQFVNFGLGNYVISCYLKQGATPFTWVQLQGCGLGSTGYCNFNISTGAVGNYGSAVSSPNIVSVGNGWWRCSFVILNVNPGTATPQFYIALTNDTNPSSASLSYTGTATKSVLAWGPQVEMSFTTTPSQYFNTSASGGNQYSPRFDYSPYKEYFNACQNSQYYGGGGWTSGAMASATDFAITAPDGTLTGIQITENTSNANHAVSIPYGTMSTNTRFIYSMFVQAGTCTTCQLSLGSFAILNGYQIWANFNLSNGTVGTVGSSVTNATITSYPNSWYRISITFNGPFGGGQNIQISMTTSASAAALQSYTGTSRYMYIWGAQIEYYRLNLLLPSQSVLGNPTTPQPYIANTNGVETQGAAKVVIVDPTITTLTLRGMFFDSGSSTNYALQSNQFTVSPWTTSNLTVTANNATGPDGIANSATLITATANNAYIMQNIATYVASGRSSIYVKSVSGSGSAYLSSMRVNSGTYPLSTTNWTRLSLARVAYTANYTQTASTTVNLNVPLHGMISGDSIDVPTTTGNITSGLYSITVVDANNVTITVATSGTTSGTVQIVSNYFRLVLPLNGDQILIYGAQYETGGSSESSYMPTIGSTASRSYETLAVPTYYAQTMFNQSKGTVYLEHFGLAGLNQGGSSFVSFVRDSFTNDNLVLRAIGSATVSLYSLYNNGVNQDLNGLPQPLRYSEKNRMAMSWSIKRLNAIYNDVPNPPVNTYAANQFGDFALALTSMQQLVFGTSNPYIAAGWYQRVVLYPTDMNQAQLTDLTNQ